MLPWSSTPEASAAIALAAGAAATRSWRRSGESSPDEQDAEEDNSWSAGDGGELCVDDDAEEEMEGEEEEEEVDEMEEVDEAEEVEGNGTGRA